MKCFLLIFILLVVFIPSVSNVYAQGKVSGHAKITFIMEEGDQAITYIGKLTKGDYMRLREALKPPPPGTANEVNVDDEKSRWSGYVDQISNAGEKQKNKKKLNEAAFNDLIGNYEVKDKKALNKVKDKKQKATTMKSSAKDDTGNYLKYITNHSIKKTPQLSKYFKISSGRRLRNGQTITKPAGGTALIITYKIREGETINTYVNIVEAYLNPDSKYNLKYHGAGTKRKYYLEYVSNSFN
jgi:hypothetical protein